MEESISETQGVKGEAQGTLSPFIVDFNSKMKSYIKSKAQYNHRLDFNTVFYLERIMYVPIWNYNMLKVKVTFLNLYHSLG